MNVREELKSVVRGIDGENAGLITKSRTYARAVGLIEHYEEHGEKENADMEREELRKFVESFRDVLTPSKLNVGDRITVASRNPWTSDHVATVVKVTPQTVTIKRNYTEVSYDNHGNPKHTVTDTLLGDGETFRWSNKTCQLVHERSYLRVGETI